MFRFFKKKISPDQMLQHDFLCTQIEENRFRDRKLVYNFINLPLLYRLKMSLNKNYTITSLVIQNEKKYIGATASIMREIKDELLEIITRNRRLEEINVSKYLLYKLI